MKHLKTLALMMAQAMCYADNKSLFGRNDEVRPNYNPIVRKPAEKKLNMFTIKGINIEAYSKKDAIKRYNHLIK